MIHHIAVTNHLGDKIVLPLSNPYSTGMNIIKVDGLGPAGGSVNVTDIATSDGSIFNSSRVGTRNIVLTLGFVDNPSTGRTVEDIRLDTYKYFPVKRRVLFEVKTSRRHVITTGYVESNEADIFSEKAGCEISILCPDSYFYEVITDTADSGRRLDFSAKRGGFTFAFENKSLEQKLLKFADLSFLSKVNLLYSGEVDTGVMFRLVANGVVKNPRLVKPEEHKELAINTSVFSAYGAPSLIDGDELVIDTRRGRKSATLIRNGVSHNIANALDRNCNWLQLHSGDNIFSYDTASGSSNLQVSLEYVTAYLGV